MAINEADSYWEKRKHSVYLHIVKTIMQNLLKSEDSVLDVGSAGCSYLDWYGEARKKTSIDLRNPYRGSGIRAIKSDFLKWEPDESYSIITCLQVLEHVPEATAFAQKLLQCGEISVVSVPYRWKKGGNISHVHDPVDRDKMLAWFGRKPNFEYIVKEVISDAPRLIHIYENQHDITYTTLNQRNRLLEQMNAG